MPPYHKSETNLQSPADFKPIIEDMHVQNFFTKSGDILVYLPSDYAGYLTKQQQI